MLFLLDNGLGYRSRLFLGGILLDSVKVVVKAEASSLRLGIYLNLRRRLSLRDIFSFRWIFFNCALDMYLVVESRAFIRFFGISRMLVTNLLDLHSGHSIIHVKEIIICKLGVLDFNLFLPSVFYSFLTCSYKVDYPFFNNSKESCNVLKYSIEYLSDCAVASCIEICHVNGKYGNCDNDKSPPSEHFHHKISKRASNKSAGSLFGKIDNGVSVGSCLGEGDSIFHHRNYYGGNNREYNSRGDSSSFQIVCIEYSVDHQHNGNCPRACGEKTHKYV